jgi:hypothetical protein
MLPHLRLWLINVELKVFDLLGLLGQTMLDLTRIPASSPRCFQLPAIAFPPPPLASLHQPLDGGFLVRLLKILTSSSHLRPFAGPI